MSEGRLTTPKPRPNAVGKPRVEDAPPDAGWGLRLFDAVLIGFFLALAFLLGVFRLKDTDFYWHLRTGNLIRKFGEVPRVDFYTFTRAGAPWIDLHWMFQVGVSWVFERGGVPALTFAKCVITCVALLLLITARKKTWPVWAMILAWLPALLVLSGRMYIRPETLTLLYLSIFLAVLCRWDRRPALAWILPATQVAWVNSHGLFILGPIVLGFALIDAALRRGAFSVERRRWWTTVASASGATGLACLLNPYGIRGALYPLELATTMSSPDFSKTIAELKPIRDFIRESGFSNVPLQIHFATIALGALSFLIPIFAAAIGRMRSFRAVEAEEVDHAPARGKKGKAADRSSKKSRADRKPKGAVEAAVEPGDEGWRISVLRLLLFAAFSLLSFQATRNSHQFAAVVGTVTAWNFAEWAGSRKSSRQEASETPSHLPGIRPRVVALVSLILMTFAVGSGALYAWMGEGRVMGWGEEPLWFPHAAAKFAGGPGMPDRFMSFHNGHASLFIYNYSPEKPGGPGKTVFTDARLEVQGPALYHRYLDFRNWITKSDPRWQRELESEGNPTILVDHEFDTEIGAALLASGRWRCVWFDDISAVLVHDSYREAVAAHEVDFGARHFMPTGDAEPQGTPALIAALKGCRDYANFLSGSYGRPDQARPMLWLAFDYARRVVAVEPGSLEAWKSIAYSEMIREPAMPSARCRAPFDPILDLSPARATYALRRASAVAPRDFLTLALLQKAYEARRMAGPLKQTLDRLVRLTPINLLQQDAIAKALDDLPRIARGLDAPTPTSWDNLDELDRLVDQELELGRIEEAVGLLERAYPPGKGGWPAVERISTLLLHLGEPERARRQLQGAADVPNPAVREVRLAACDLVECEFEKAREHYRLAIELDPRLFEARYGLALLEQDDGRAKAAHEQATTAMECAPNDASRSAARTIEASVRRYAGRARSN